jgi:pimeloyl-ACP methyl ester carboxylesterase
MNAPMKAATRRSLLCFSLTCVLTLASVVDADDYTPGGFHEYSYNAGNVSKDVYQYSVFVPKDYDPKAAYPLVFYLHGGGKGRKHPNQGRRNMVSERLRDNDRTTDAGYSRTVPDFRGYVLVSPVKPVARWKAPIFKRLYDHVTSRISIDENRVYVTGFSMGGQGTWHVACGTDGSYKIAAMMPLGAWGCNEVKRGTTTKTCKTTKTATWVLHCPLDNVSKIGEQLTLFQNHLECGGYGRFTMIPGKGHIKRPRDDRAFFNLRMEWMLAQTYGTPFNYIVRLDGGEISKVASGKRTRSGDKNSYGFFEPGTVLNITAPAMRDGKPFVKWASLQGRFSAAASRSTSYTTVEGDVVISAIYGGSAPTLKLAGGTASPSAPAPGQVVTITADADTDEKTFSHWTTSTRAIDIAIPSARSFKLVMPSENVSLTAHGKRKRKR